MLCCDMLFCVVFVCTFVIVGLPCLAALKGVMLHRTQLHKATHKQTRCRVQLFAFRPVIYKLYIEDCMLFVVGCCRLVLVGSDW